MTLLQDVMEPHDLLAEFLAGPAGLRESVSGLTDSQLDAIPVPERWSIRQVVCHLADCEIIYAGRIKRVLAEDNPTLAGMCPDAFQQRLPGSHRDLEDELRLIEATRRHLAGILHGADVELYQRTGVHSEDGPLTLETLLERITHHIPHHVAFIQEKRAVLDGTSM